jgi:hypothetical protein
MNVDRQQLIRLLEEHGDAEAIAAAELLRSGGDFVSLGADAAELIAGIFLHGSYYVRSARRDVSERDAAIDGVEIGKFRGAVAVAKGEQMYAVLFSAGADAVVACLAMPPGQ